jgi:NTP pyrophosphatase (non-canonical NTP hydrolase)
VKTALYLTDYVEIACGPFTVHAKSPEDAAGFDATDDGAVDFLRRVRAERARQFVLYGPQGQNRTIFEMVSVLHEESGEVARGANEAYLGGELEAMENFVLECVQVAATALACAQWALKHHPILTHGLQPLNETHTEVLT